LSKEELEQMNLTALSVLCRKVMEDTSMDSDTADKAAGLIREWTILVGRETPHAPDLKTHNEIQAAKQALKNRMVDFLVLI
jgi:hypothetical protein